MPDSREPQLDELRRRARRRLVGAVVLALAAAVLVPLLLESDPKPLGEDVAVKIPPIDDGKFVSKVGDKGKTAEPAPAAPKVEARAPKAEAAAPPAPAAAAASKDAPVAAAAAKDAPAVPAEASKESAKALANAEQRVLAPPQKSAPVPAPAKAATPPPVKEASLAPAPKAETSAKPAETEKAGIFAVQLAAFIDDKGANALAGRLKKAGYPAYTEAYETTRGTLWRVRVGPYPSRDAAEGVRAKLKGEGHNGIIAAAK